MIERLEPRVAPAVLTGSILTYKDVDGEIVTVTLKTKAVLAPANFTFDTGFGDASTGAQQLQLINLSGDVKNDGASIVVTTDGTVDGKVNIGYINATGRDLKTVTIPGDLGQIDSGDPLPDAGVGKLTVDSLGKLGITTQAAGGSISSLITGSLKSLTVSGDFAGDLRVLHVPNITKPAVLLGKVIIGGDLDGTSQNDAKLSAEGSIGNLLIKGKIRASATAGTATIQADEVIKKLTVGVPATAGAPPPADIVVLGVGKDSATITADGSDGKASIGSLTIYGSVKGGDDGSAYFNATSNSIAKILITGNVVGGTGTDSGRIEADSFLRSVTILGNLQGGDGISSGKLIGVDGIGKVKIVGSVIGGTKLSSGFIDALGPFKSIEIGGSLTGNSGENSGGIFGTGIGKVLIKHDVTSGTGPHSGNIVSDSFLGSVSILGKVTGTAAHNVVIMAKSAAKVTSKSDIAIKSVKVTGVATFLDIFAGYSGSATGDIQPVVDGNAGIGSVTFGASVSGVNIAAGVDPQDGKFGNAGDFVPGSIAPLPFATIGKIVVTGTVDATADVNDSFGFTAQLIKSAKINGVKQTLLPKQSNDTKTLSADTVLKELA